jgi:hypothetical protein
VTPEDVARHEAGHAVACILLGIPVAGARIEWGPDGWLTGGSTLTPGLFADGLDKERAHDIVVMVMCGPIMEGRDLPEWPPSRVAHQLDERYMAIYSDYLGLTEASWHGLCGEAYHFTCTDEFCRLWEAVTGLLERVPDLDEVGLRIARRIGGV